METKSISTRFKRYYLKGILKNRNFKLFTNSFYLLNQYLCLLQLLRYKESGWINVIKTNQELKN